MKAQCLSVDRISTLSPTIVETILCLLPIQEAVKTCLLSKKWRYVWTTIPKLVFNEDLSNLPPDGPARTIKRSEVFYGIYQVLLMHQGPIYEFTLDMMTHNKCIELDRIIFHLSRYNSLNKFKLDVGYNFWWPATYRLPLSIFLLHHLTDLYLQGCCLDHPPTSIGFVNLTSLHLEDVDTTTETILHIISKSPLLKSFNIYISPDLSMKLGLREPAIYDIFEHLPVIENLTINIFAVECFIGNVVPRACSLVHLKCLCLEELSLVQPNGLHFLVLLLQSSPNLEKIKLQMLPLVEEGQMLPPDERRSVHDCADIWLNFLKILKIKEHLHNWLAHLNKLEIVYFSYRKPELEFVKLILAKAPLLKKVLISLHETVSNHEELKLCKMLLRSPHASHQVEIIVVGPRDGSSCVGSNYELSQCSRVR